MNRETMLSDRPSIAPSLAAFQCCPAIRFPQRAIRLDSRQAARESGSSLEFVEELHPNDLGWFGWVVRLCESDH